TCLHPARLTKVVRMNGRHDGLTEIELHKDPRCIEIIEYDLGFQLHTAFERGRLDGTVVRRAAGKPKITNARKVLQLQPLIPRQRIGPRDEQEQALTRDSPLLDPACRIAGCDEPEVGL